MQDSARALAALMASLFLGILILAGAAAASPPAWSQDTPPEEPEAQAGGPTGEEPAVAPELTPEERKRKAKEERIAAYLRAKEEKRARREAEGQAVEQQATEQQAGLALELEKQQLAEEAEQAEATQAEPEPIAPVPARTGPPLIPRLPDSVVKAQNAVRQTPLGQNPTIKGYQDLIDQRQVSVQQLAAFANFLAEAGMNRAASVYYEFALTIEKKDATLWVNAGTLRRQLGELSEASKAYKRALAISPANALAHYNLGAVLDDQGRYNKAIEEYRLALTIDPSLGDPAVNPQAAHNPRLVAVKLLLYQEQIGSLGLPLVPISSGELATSVDVD